MQDFASAVSPAKYISSSQTPLRPVDWNNLFDDMDKEVWDRLTGNFWLPEKIPLANDISSWKSMTKAEQEAAKKVFAGLTLLDTIQGTIGAPELQKIADNQHAEAVFANINFMEAFAQDTELLTPSGWKKIEDVTYDDEVASFDPETLTYKFYRPDYIPTPFVSDLFEFYNKDGKLIHPPVSTNHRMAYFVDNEDGEKICKEVLAHEFISAIELEVEQGFNPHLLAYTHSEEELDLPDREIDLAGAWSKIPGQGEVFCVTVPTTYLIVRHHLVEDYSVVSGNCVHAKSYSSIFNTLCSKEENDEIVRWAIENERLQTKAHMITENYIMGVDEHMTKEQLAERDSLSPEELERRTLIANAKKFASSVMLESFLFYSGFYLPLRFSNNAKITNTADLIKLIIRDEAVHGFYIGYKFQTTIYNKLSPEDQEEIKTWLYEFLDALYENELKFTREVYDEIGWTEDVYSFLRYNANKALANLGFEPRFQAHEISDEANKQILAAMGTDDENHDFFSSAGSSYVIGKVNETTDDDWDY